MNDHYGARLKAGELIKFIDYLIGVNLQAEAAGRRKTPVCIWGRHGIGKTEVVEDYARRKGYAFVHVAPAQFEEMGDLLGMPQIAQAGTEAVTTFRPPEWVPRAEGPGILLIDDLNRADDRILRGLMQLLQDFRLVSWALPARWQIILTANPDEGDYSVTPMDDALLTRMRHVTLAFDVVEWARWAERRGVDSRGINFVLAFPESITGRRTTPRTLVQFFEATAGIDDLAAELPLVQALGAACLDAETVAAFVTFVQQALHQLPGPALILKTEDFEREVKASLERRVQGEVLRVDILSALCTRLIYFLRDRPVENKRELQNLKAFLTLEFLPADLRLSTAQEMTAMEDPFLQQLLSDPQLGELLL